MDYAGTKYYHCSPTRLAHAYTSAVLVPQLPGRTPDLWLLSPFSDLDTLHQ